MSEPENPDTDPSRRKMSANTPGTVDEPGNQSSPKRRFAGDPADLPRPHADVELIRNNNLASEVAHQPEIAHPQTVSEATPDPVATRQPDQPRAAAGAARPRKRRTRSEKTALARKVKAPQPAKSPAISTARHSANQTTKSDRSVIGIAPFLRPIKAAVSQVGRTLSNIWVGARTIDSHLWRAIKRGYRIVEHAITTVADWIIAGLVGFFKWLPTKAGQGYCAFAGIVAVISGLWVAEEIRATDLIVEQAFAAAPVGQSASNARDPIMARIGSEYIRLSKIEASAHSDGSLAKGEKLAVNSDNTRERVAAYLDQRLLVRAARDQNLEREPAVALRLSVARERLLAAAYLEKIIDERVTREQVAKLYAAQSDITALGEEIHARHILVGTRSEAISIITALDRGADFSTLARSRSLDRGTAPHGGDMGYITRDMVSDEFGRMAFSVNEGAVSLPFQTDDGWNVVQILEKRTTQPIAFEGVEADLQRFLTLRTIDETLNALKQQYEVVIIQHGDEPKNPAVTTPPIRE